MSIDSPSEAESVPVSYSWTAATRDSERELTVRNAKEPDVRLRIIEVFARPFPINLVLHIRHCDRRGNDAGPFRGACSCQLAGSADAWDRVRSNCPARERASFSHARAGAKKAKMT